MNQRIWRSAGIALAIAAVWLNVALLPAQDYAAFAREEAPMALETGAAGQERILIPGGQVVGVALHTQGVLVVAKTTREGIKSPLRVGDVILSVQGQAIDGVKALSDAVNAAEAEMIELNVLRRGREMTVQTAAPADSADGRRRLGVWARDSTAGVGTLSYIDPVTLAYGALGHHRI